MYCSSLVAPSGEVKARSALSVRTNPGGGPDAASVGAAVSSRVSAIHDAVRENAITEKILKEMGRGAASMIGRGGGLAGSSAACGGEACAHPIGRLAAGAKSAQF